MATTRTKNKRKKKKIVNQLALMKKKKKQTRRNILIFSLASLIFSGASYYVTYYQATNLSMEDTQNITDGFYYLRDLKTELEAIQAGKAEESSKQTITFVVTSLAGYSVKKANTLNTIEGQSVLNRYYNAMSELGINVSRRASDLYHDPETIKESLADIEKVVGYQRSVFAFFKVDESVLQAEK